MIQLDWSAQRPYVSARACDGTNIRRQHRRARWRCLSMSTIQRGNRGQFACVGIYRVYSNRRYRRY